MSLSAQAKVLRSLKENKITRVGGDKEISVDVRVVAATNKDLLHEVDMGNFRLDLYHRISVILIHVPSLNERADDIPLLTERFIKEICEDYGIPKKVITPKAMMEMQNIQFTGNIRELRNVIERLVILSDQKITEEDVIAYAQSPKSGGSPKDLYERFEKFQDFKDYIEKEFIIFRLNKNNWNVSKTADELDIQRSHLYNKIEKYNLKRD
jgi:DNA-binding NtrC family response regulator